MSTLLALEEKRKHTRTDKKILLRVASQQNGAAPQWTIVSSKNISAGGLLFGYDRELERGTPLYVRIHFPNRAIDCNATVRRSTPGIYGPLTDVAISLKGLEREEKDFIQSFVA